VKSSSEIHCCLLPFQNAAGEIWLVKKEKIKQVNHLYSWTAAFHLFVMMAYE